LRSFIIGTAGHIDHGKTQLIKALTGVDTDRLKEEKERGISIELGFAEFPLPDGTVAGVVDVPGHEHFVKNMLAGATGFDLVLLVVAADDGVMPQTREHLAIIDLLDVREGLVVITKADLVDEEMIELVKEEVAEVLKGTTLEGTEILVTSTVTGEGLDEVVNAIVRAAERVRVRQTEGPFRLPIDRVFTLKGIGTVVTGTLWEGSISDGEVAVLLPSNREVRVRNVQVHGRDVERALAGQRVALNLPGISTEEIERGDVVISPGHLSPTFMVDVRLHLIKEAPRPLKNRSRIRFHHATREVLGRVVLLQEKEELEPGESCYAQMRLESPVVAKYGDNFILRSYSPVTTIGGGTILNSHAQKHRRINPQLMQALKLRESGVPERLLLLIFKESPLPRSEEELIRESEIPRSTVKEVISRMLQEGTLVKIQVEQRWKVLPSELIKDYEQRIWQLLEGYHQSHPREIGMEKEALRSRLGKHLTPGDFDGIMRYFLERDLFELKEGKVCIKGRGRSLTKEEQEEKKKLIEQITSAGFSPPFVKELAERHGLDARKVRDYINILLEEGAIEQVNPEFFLARGKLKEAEEKIRSFITERGRLEVKDLKEMLGISRKYSIPLLEYFDRIKVTRREGDFRVLR
jgi:selenocysteine-specific elongation factor